MGLFSKLLTGYKFVVGSIDRGSADYSNTIVFDTNSKEIIADGTVFVCHNNDEEEEVSIRDLVVKNDELETQIAGLMAQLQEVKKTAEVAMNSIEFYRSIALEISGELEKCTNITQRLEGIVNNLAEDDKMDDQNMQNWENIVTETRERVLANEQSIADWKESMNSMGAILVNNNQRIDALEKASANAEVPAEEPVPAKKTKRGKKLLTD